MKHKTTKIQGFLLRRFLDSKTPGNAHAHLGIIVITSFHTSGSRTPIGGERQNPGFNSPVEDGNLSHDFTLGVFCSTNPRWWLFLFLNAGFLNTNDSTVVKKEIIPKSDTWSFCILYSMNLWSSIMLHHHVPPHDVAMVVIDSWTCVYISPCSTGHLT